MVNASEGRMITLTLWNIQYAHLITYFVMEGSVHGGQALPTVINCVTITRTADLKLIAIITLKMPNIIYLLTR